MIEEEWRPVTGYEGLYSVSNFGRVKSESIVVTDRLGRSHRIIGQIKIPAENEWGYLWVTLTKDGMRKHHKVHRLVAQAFLQKDDGKEFVNHKDGNKTNNNVENLEWVTSKENQQHAFRTGLNSQKYKKRCIRSDGVVFDSLSKAANATGVSLSNVSRCCSGKRKTSMGTHLAIYNYVFWAGIPQRDFVNLRKYAPQKGVTK